MGTYRYAPLSGKEEGAQQLQQQRLQQHVQQQRCGLEEEVPGYRFSFPYGGVAGFVESMFRAPS